ncbi:MAG: cyclic nucleotide-binding domain-containing protein [Anaerolineae bacterium]|jgi:CRP-like cAMP-binding protein|nr:cyclic nucleotide-binding domain-containing protein [Anaerolineae bacterium]
MQRIKFLREVDIFYGLRDEHLQALAEVCHEAMFKEGAMIVGENMPSDELYLIVKGAVDIAIDPSLVDTKNTEDLGPMTIVTLMPGQCFGEIGLVDQGLRSASAHALYDETHLLAIHRRDLLRLCEQNYELGYYLMRNIASELAFKIRNTDMMLRAQLLWKPRSEIAR